MQEEVSMMQITGAGQTNAKMMRTRTCRYCGSSHPPRCPAYGMMCGECGRVNLSAQCAEPQDEQHPDEKNRTMDKLIR